MGKKRVFLCFGFLLFLTMFLGITSAITITNPTTSGTISGASFYFNISHPLELNHTRNCTIYASSSLTANSSAISIGTITNTTEYENYTNGTIDTTSLEDANNYVIYATCMNVTTTSSATASLTSILVDNTIPQTPSGLSPVAASTDTDGSVTFSATVTGANTTACTLYFTGRNPGSSSYSMTHTANTCTYTNSNVLDETYVYYIQASDGTNTTNSAETRFNVLSGGNSNSYMFQNEEAAQIKQQKQQPLSIALGNLIVPGWVVALVFIIVIIVIVGAVRRK